MTIEQCLASDRPDVNVAEWLQERVWGSKSQALSADIWAAFRVDEILTAVNMEGFESALDNYQGEISVHIDALKSVDLADVAELAEKAQKCWQNERDAMQLDALSRQFIAQSNAIEAKLHGYIQQHIDAFKRFD